MQRRATRHVEAAAGDVGGILGKKEGDRLADILARSLPSERVAVCLGCLPARLGIAGREAAEAHDGVIALGLGDAVLDLAAEIRGYLTITP